MTKKEKKNKPKKKNTLEKGLANVHNVTCLAILQWPGDVLMITRPSRLSLTAHHNPNLQE